MYEELKNKLSEFAKGRLKPSRYAHTEGVVKTASLLAEKYGVDKDKAEIAAWFHDAFRETGNLQHGPIAAEKLQQLFGVNDPDIINAVKWHTTGRPGMSDLEKVIYIADSIEPSRDYPGVENYRKHAMESLEETCYFIMKHTKEYVESLGVAFDECSIEALKEYENTHNIPAQKEKKMDSKELALAAAKALDARKGFDIRIINIAEKSSFADYFVLASAKSIRQLQALSTETEDELAKLDVCVRSIEGKGESGWILMDFGDVVINLFTEAQRDKYNIEKIWSDCPTEEYVGEN